MGRPRRLGAFVLLVFWTWHALPAVAARAPYLDSPAVREVEAALPLLERQPGLVAGPAIVRVVASASGAIGVGGLAEPLAIILVAIDGRLVATPLAGADGRWHADVVVSAVSGEIALSTSARSAGTVWPVPGQKVRVSLPAASFAAQQKAQPSRIYDFGRIGLLANAPETIVTRVRVAGESWSGTNASLRHGTMMAFSLAQAETAPATQEPAQPAAEPPATAPSEPAADAVVAPVKREAPKTPAVAEPEIVPSAAPAAPVPEAPAAKPAAAPEKKPQAPTQKAAPQQSATKSPPPPPDVGGIFSRVQDWLARANREYQGTIVKELSQPSTAGADADAIAAAKKRELEKAAEATKAGEAKRLEDEKKRAEQAKSEASKTDTAKAAEAKKKAEELKQAAEKKAADAAKKAEAAKAPDGQKAAEEAQKAEAAKQAEATKKAEEAKKQAEAAQKAEEAKKQAEAAKQAEEQKRAEDAAKAAAAQETESAKDIEAEKLRAANEAARLAEQKRVEEQKRAEQLRALEAKRKQVEEAQRKSDEAQRRADDAKRRAEERAVAEPRAPVQPEAEPRPSETAADTSKHRRLTITINPEPIGRPRAEPTVGRPEVTPPKPEFSDQTLVADRSGVDDGVYIGNTRLRQRVRVYREATYRDTGRYVRGPAVKRWLWRAKYGGCSGAGRRSFAPKRYVVARGDSLWRISSRHYKSGRHYGRIYRANRDRIRDPDLIYPCQRFLVPRRR